MMENKVREALQSIVEASRISNVLTFAFKLTLLNLPGLLPQKPVELSRQKLRLADQFKLSANSKLKDFLSVGVDVFKDVMPEAKTVVRGFQQGMVTAHLGTTGLLVVGKI